MERKNGAQNKKRFKEKKEESPEKITLYALLNVKSNATKEEIVFFIFLFTYKKYLFLKFLNQPNKINKFLKEKIL